MPRSMTLAAALLLVPTAFAAERIETYESLVEHLMAGGKVRAVIDVSKTKYKVNDVATEAPDVRSGYAFETWQHFGVDMVQNVRSYVTLYARYDSYILAQASANTYLIEVRVDSQGDGELRVRHLVPRSTEIPLLVEHEGPIAGGDAPIKIFKDER